MSLDDLQAQLRGALDQQFAALKTHYEDAIAEARRQAQADAEHELQAKLVAARAEWEEQLNAQVAAVRAEAEQASADAEARLREEFDQVRDQAVASVRRSAELEIESERRRAQKDVEAERTRAQSDIEAAQQRARGEIDGVRAQLQAQIATARETATREAAAAAAARLSAAPGSGAASGAPYEQVAAGIRALDAAQSLGASLDTLVAQAAAIAGRAALFLINGDRLKAWKSSGIPDIDTQTVESSITGRDLLARAIQSGQLTSSSSALPAPPFARLPADRTGVAVPLMIAGRAIAVLYVDAGIAATAAAADWPGAVDLLVRHASALLALRTAMRTFDMLRGVPEGAGTNGDSGEEGARRYARLLVSEIKLYNEGAVRVGRQQRDLLHRLQEEINRAQRLYQERIPAAVSARDAYFHQELVQTLAGGDASLLGT